MVGVALRFVNLGAAPLWFDETYTFHHLVIPWDGWLQAVMKDNQAPVYYAIAKVWTETTGVSPWLMRVPGLLASVACIPLSGRDRPGADRCARHGLAAWLAAISRS